jgi:outer membrane protein assembly factor BamE
MAAAATLMLTTGCLYRMDIKQGNLLDPTQVLELKEGMTKSQVKFLLGTPMLPNGFNSDRWNYYYYEKNQRMSKADTRRVTVWFKDDIVERYERPADTELAAAYMARENEEALKNASETALPPPRSNTPAVPGPTPGPGR